jgi:hypothetical protein
MTQLAAFIAANGPLLQLRTRTLEVLGISSDGDTAVASFRAAKATYTGIVCVNATVHRRPGAEVWSVVGPRGRTIADFAIHERVLVSLTR